MKHLSVLVEEARVAKKAADDEFAERQCWAIDRESGRSNHDRWINAATALAVAMIEESSPRHLSGRCDPKDRDRIDLHGERRSDAGDCTCYHTCERDSHSGDWHQHEDEPCPVHPEATMVG